MKATEHKLQIYLPGPLYRHLKGAAAARGESLSAYLRRLLARDRSNGSPGVTDPLLALLQNRRPVGPRDGSEHVDQYLYGKP